MELGIRFKYSSLGHLQDNRQVEVTNKFLLEMLKNRLMNKKGD